MHPRSLQEVHIITRTRHFKYPEVDDKIVHFQFPGPGQRKTSVTDARGIVELVILLPGQQAAEMRCMAARIIVRLLGGDTSLVVEVCSIRKFQEHLALR